MTRDRQTSLCILFAPILLVAAWDSTAQAYAASNGSTSNITSYVQTSLDYMKEQGLTVVRTWGFGTTSSTNLQIAPGQYNESVFESLDYVISEAAKRNIYYIQWCGTQSMDEFFTKEECKQLYKNHVQHFLTHVNVFSGISYLDDPTILGWNLLNEPRTDNWFGSNKSTTWEQKIQFVDLWLTCHINDAKLLGKPLIYEEFGKAITPKDDISVKDTFFRNIYSRLQQSMQEGGPVQGSAFWVFESPGKYHEPCNHCRKRLQLSIRVRSFECLSPQYGNLVLAASLSDTLPGLSSKLHHFSSPSSELRSSSTGGQYNYTVLPGDSTMGIIEAHTSYVDQLQSSINEGGCSPVPATPPTPSVDAPALAPAPQYFNTPQSAPSDPSPGPDANSTGPSPSAPEPAPSQAPTPPPYLMVMNVP
ncbi:mannan endo-1,4-beta-mannosidase [Klebsormidium nitens]|uniref:mannan endo-1,4-beta-mannosidase n=1 Tax=Klebsormidium nitens TaxID=105231 RepID=A0A1Y1I3S1_KLENI|nr:mannan endo-1,4-beta-mannosidase [Klebsormidium nitens]|eukprot:GAQ84059.1 mannan endo-1,4-beta-mannosidase [Klebsormidium nitens]